MTAGSSPLRPNPRFPTVAIAFSLLSLAEIRAAYAVEPINDGDLRDKAAYLCEWRSSHPENPTPLAYCGSQDEPQYMRVLHMQDWWQWMFNKYTQNATPMRDKFNSDWIRYRKPLVDGAEQRQAEEDKAKAVAENEQRARERSERLAAEATAERAGRKREEQLARARLARELKAEKEQRRRAFEANEARINSSATAMSPVDLCADVHSGSRVARAELERRNALSENEWRLVDDSRVAVGMSEIALICSRGRARVNRTVTVQGEHKQFVYGDAFVYVEQGRVVAFQDHTD